MRFLLIGCGMCCGKYRIAHFWLIPLFSVSTLCAAQISLAPNSDPTYKALRSVGLSGESVAITNFELKRDASTFHLRNGTVCFVAPVNGKVTGAVFSGQGTLVLDPPNETERSSLRLLTRSNEYSEHFWTMVLRFTDHTYEQLKQLGTPGSQPCDAGPLKDSQSATRHRLRYNLEARILEDVLSDEPGRFFAAFIQGQNYSDRTLFVVDPHGVPEFAEEVFGEQALAFPLAPEEVMLMTYADHKHGYWGSFHLAPEYKEGTALTTQQNGVIEITHQQLDTTIERSGHLNGKAITSIVSRVNGLRVVPLSLYRTLRVQTITGEDGQQLPFIQEDKNEDSQLFVILPKPVSAGEKFALTTVYGGKDAVTNEGAGNYLPTPGARENWYPTTAGALFGSYCDYDLTFRVPRNMQMVATGRLLKSSEEGGQAVTVWKSEVPQVVAGFSLGRFKLEETKLEKPEIDIRSFANQEPPNWVESLKNATANQGSPAERYAPHAEVALGNMNTTPLNKKALSEGEVAERVYADYFGPSMFKHLDLTQQTACNFGQSWPGLVWIPICYYFDTTVRHQLGMDFRDLGYWRAVTAHEVAHQWWGHTIGFSSYRDQWMSEGFADMSAGLYLSMIDKNPKKAIEFWNDERLLLTEKDAEGFRAIDAGPLTLGYRLANSRTGSQIPSRLLYPKGAYVLHMIRMMMFDNHTGDQRFKETMHDFVKTYSGKAATTEDFKAMVEKHMTREMDLEGNRRMDWFFNEYVYGTQLPSYKLDAQFESGADGDVVLSMKLTQSNVDERFRMLVPLYLEMPNGNMFFLGRGRATGNTTIEQKIPLKGVKTKPRSAVVNYYNDVLAATN